MFAKTEKKNQMTQNNLIGDIVVHDECIVNDNVIEIMKVKMNTCCI